MMILVKWWARNILKIGGVKVDVSGLENISDSQNVCFVSNHQSNFDIAIVITSLPLVFGFIAKNELKKYLPLRVWMDQIKCLYIDRSKPKDAIKLVQERICSIKNGNPLLIFPEGTRSKTGQMQNFKTGSLKLLIENKIDIVPISINGSFLCYEKNKRITPGKIKLQIHQSVKITDQDILDKTNLIRNLYETIESGLSA